MTPPPMIATDPGRVSRLRHRPKSEMRLGCSRSSSFSPGRAPCCRLLANGGDDSATDAMEGEGELADGAFGVVLTGGAQVVVAGASVGCRAVGPAGCEQGRPCRAAGGLERILPDCVRIESDETIGGDPA
jgi:hypothetical protein